MSAFVLPDATLRVPSWDKWFGKPLGSAIHSSQHGWCVGGGCGAGAGSSGGGGGGGDGGLKRLGRMRFTMRGQDTLGFHPYGKCIPDAGMI